MKKIIIRNALLMGIFFLLFACKEDKKSSDVFDANMSDSIQDLGISFKDSLEEAEEKVEENIDGVSDSYIKCEDAGEGIKKIGEECADHCECETGWCYDEGYMSPFRYCTRPCLGDCGIGYKCLLFLPQVHDVLHTNICMPICNTLDDCKKLSEKYEYCPKNETKWAGYTLALVGTCQIIEGRRHK